MCMVVEALTGKTVTPQTMAKYSIKVGARLNSGTDMHTLGKAAADRWGLTMTTSDDIDAVIDALNNGAQVVANAGGDRKGYKGLFSNGGHYIVLTDFAAGRLSVRDSGYYSGKFQVAGRINKVTVNSDESISVIPGFVDIDCSNRSPRYYIFRKAVDVVTQTEFDAMLKVAEKRYNTLAEVPTWAEPTVRKLCDYGYLLGHGGGKDRNGYPTDLNLTEDMLRILVMTERAGLYDAKKEW